MNMSMCKVGKLFSPCKKPLLWIPEMDHSLSKLNTANLADKFS